MFTHLSIDCERYSDSYCSTTFLPTSHPLVKYLIKKGINCIDLHRYWYDIPGEPKECSLIFERIIQYLLYVEGNLRYVKNKPIRITHNIKSTSYLMSDDFGDDDDDLKDAINASDLDELRTIKVYIESEVKLPSIDSDLLRTLNLNDQSLQDPKALAEILPE